MGIKFEVEITDEMLSKAIKGAQFNQRELNSIVYDAVRRKAKREISTELRKAMKGLSYKELITDIIEQTDFNALVSEYFESMMTYDPYE